MALWVKAKEDTTFEEKIFRESTVFFRESTVFMEQSCINKVSQSRALMDCSASVYLWEKKAPQKKSKNKKINKKSRQSGVSINSVADFRRGYKRN